MSYRYEGLVVAKKLNEITGQNRAEIGQAVFLQPDGTVSANAASGRPYPLIMPVQAGDNTAEIQVTGIAKVKMKVNNEPEAGDPISAESGTGLGIAAAALTDEGVFGYAFAPVDDNGFVPVMLFSNPVALTE